MPSEQGWSVMIKCENGREFLCHGSEGILSPVWPKSRRSLAVEHKRMLRAHGFNARVVPVTFTRPEIIKEPSNAQ